MFPPERLPLGAVVALYGMLLFSDVKWSFVAWVGSLKPFHS